MSKGEGRKDGQQNLTSRCPRLPYVSTYLYWAHDVIVSTVGVDQYCTCNTELQYTFHYFLLLLYFIYTIKYFDNGIIIVGTPNIYLKICVHAYPLNTGTIKLSSK
jgi:hypothetical protein